jgi:hypothetical protein
MMRFSHFLGSSPTDGGDVASLTHWQAFTPREIFFVLISVRG